MYVCMCNYGNDEHRCSRDKLGIQYAIRNISICNPYGISAAAAYVCKFNKILIKTNRDCKV